MPAESAVPPVTSGAVRLHPGDLMSKWGFDDGDPFIDHDDLYPGIDGVDPRALLVELVKEFVLPSLEVHYGQMPEPVGELTPEAVYIPYPVIIETAARLRAGSENTDG